MIIIDIKNYKKFSSIYIIEITQNIVYNKKNVINNTNVYNKKNVINNTNVYNKKNVIHNTNVYNKKNVIVLSKKFWEKSKKFFVFQKEKTHFFMPFFCVEKLIREWNTENKRKLTGLSGKNDKRK